MLRETVNNRTCVLVFVKCCRSDDTEHVLQVNRTGNSTGRSSNPLTKVSAEYNGMFLFFAF